MKKLLFTLLAAVPVLFASCTNQFNATYLLSGGMKAAQALSLSDEQIQSYVGQYVQQLDAQNPVLPETSPYVKRLRNMTRGITQVDGIPLNFKVYKTDDVNAFACADGSVRIYSGLMDVMTDDELLGVVGHEIGHVALKHTKKQFKQALLTSAVRDALVSAGGYVATLSASELGSLGEALAGASFSRKQENQADDFGYDFLKAAGRNQAMAMAFENSSGCPGIRIQVTPRRRKAARPPGFSSHPDTATRIQRMSDRATADGYKKPVK